ncbi:MAG: glutathione S-transferase family protein, partial [Nevskiales bacterium]
MSDLVLHHYAMSPFSQKIRSMLGYAGLEWQSVVCKEMPPRPHLETLAGGYRKMPVGQIGADIFCDTRSIATEIARLAGKPELALENCSAEVQAYVARVDLEMFFACLLSSGTLRMAMKVWRSMSLLDIARFFADRIKLGRKASVKAIGLKEARKLLHEHLADMESRLEKADFLFGNKPNHADFSAFHSLWFAVDLAESKHADDYPAVQGWLARLRWPGWRFVVRRSGVRADGL